MSVHTSTGSDHATNVTARAVNTVAWLSDADTAIVVPVYQRQYRWDIGRCEQLLADIRAVATRAAGSPERPRETLVGEGRSSEGERSISPADSAVATRAAGSPERPRETLVGEGRSSEGERSISPADSAVATRAAGSPERPRETLVGEGRSSDRQTHFLGSILSVNSGDSTSDGLGELVLIDGQQRITTLMLLAAAVQHTLLAIADPDSTLISEIEHLLVRAGRDGAGTRTKLRPHEAWAEVFERVVLGRPAGPAGVEDSSFDDNYAFFRSQISASEAPQIWRGLKKLEHVAISLAADANAQQIFESLNSTGEPLRDHELIHNYVLMGLSHAEQTEIETTFWGPIEQCTGDAIGRFWRHYLVMASGREVALTRDGSGERGVYDAFQQRFPRLDHTVLAEHASQWLSFAQVYQVLLEPEREPDPVISRHLRGVNVFGPGMYPLVMRVYHDYRAGAMDADVLVRTLQNIQSLLLRRTVAEIGISRLVARLCRAAALGPEELTRAMARITPSDERVRVALKYRPLPHAGYVLSRLAGADGIGGLDVEHVFPLAPPDGWTGDGVRVWAEYSEDEQNSHRALAQTLGNLTLLEIPLADRTDELSFPDKRVSVYPRSVVTATSELADVTTWGTAAIAARTARLTAELFGIWARPGADLGVLIDDDGLTPILDAVRRRGWPRGWEREFDYVEYRGEHWEVHDVKYLFNRVFKRLWADSRSDVETFIGRRGGPIFDAPAWNGQWDALDGGRHLYMGWDAKYMLTAVQEVLDQAGISREVYVRYSYIGELM